MAHDFTQLDALYSAETSIIASTLAILKLQLEKKLFAFVHVQEIVFILP